ncbi:30S ribosomal protein S6 [Numidum massiliense]|uniref:30S ribosomal protein S6 n=1 Tax=Numidum massiliense TaxID=1522315 RepID=UPI0006D5715D|nr:30S ribosomal protein S6 [Numidum massiliense]
MTHYELMVVYAPNLEEEALGAAKEKVQQAIANNGGTVGEVKEMGKRRLAYEINDFREGVYQVVNFEAENLEIVNELERVIKIDDRMIRHLVINLTKDKKE